MRVSQFTKTLGVAPDTVRYYTRIGFLFPQINSDNGYKEYGSFERNRLHFILSARHLGFSVKDIKSILIGSDKGQTSCLLVRELIEKRLEETELQFQQMLKLRTRMRSAIKDWQDKPNKAATSEMICHLIESFSNPIKEET